MCETCGCGDPEVVPVEVQESLLAGNDRTARHNREHFTAAGVLAVNLMGSPGSGKTALLEATARHLDGKWRMAAMSGDLETDNDARRLSAAGIPCRPITTGSACHLDARLVHRELHHMAWRPPQGKASETPCDLLFIENVGNLVCPAIYDLGQEVNVVALAVTEGDDKPLKYPVMFRKADLVLLTKVDLLPHLPQLDLAALEDALARTMPDPQVIQVSATTGEGIPEWVEWLARHRPAAADHNHDSSQAHSHDEAVAQA